MVPQTGLITCKTILSTCQTDRSMRDPNRLTGLVSTPVIRFWLSDDIITRYWFGRSRFAKPHMKVMTREVNRRHMTLYSVAHRIECYFLDRTLLKRPRDIPFSWRGGRHRNLFYGKITFYLEKEWQTIPGKVPSLVSFESLAPNWFTALLLGEIQTKRQALSRVRSSFHDEVLKRALYTLCNVPTWPVKHLDCIKAFL